MTKKTFRSMVILVLCMLAVCVGLIMGVLYNYFDKQFYRELQNEASYISEGVELNGMDYLENISSGSMTHAEIILVFIHISFISCSVSRF